MKSPRFKLRVAEDLPACDARYPLTGGSRLTEFFERWFLPVVLEGHDRRRGTIDKYQSLLRWWRGLTSNPPLRDIDEPLIADFLARLKKVTYQRGVNGPQRKLRLWTVKGHARNLRTLINRAAKAIVNGAPLIAHAPEVPTIIVPAHVKPAFTIDQAIRIAAACERMDRPEMPPRPVGLTPDRWWRAWVGLLFYTGLRTGTVAKLRWHDLEESEGRFYLNVPAQTTKTNRALRMVLHPQAVMVLPPRSGVSADHVILPHPPWQSTVLKYHRILQTIAGLGADEVQSPHAWRRTHAQCLAELGLGFAEELSSRALDHTTVRTTLNHYVDAVDAFRLKLPNLWPDGTRNERQLPLWKDTTCPVDPRPRTW